MSKPIATYGLVRDGQGGESIAIKWVPAVQGSVGEWMPIARGGYQELSEMIHQLSDAATAAADDSDLQLIERAALGDYSSPNVSLQAEILIKQLSAALEARIRA